MFESLEQIDQLSEKYQICTQDILFIGLNALGLNNDATQTSRMRFYARLRERPEKEFRFILSTGRTQSPFSISDGNLKFKGSIIADIRDTYDDAAVIGYFRGNKDVITLNSNSRSQCIGCVFCPNTLEGSSDPKTLVVQELVSQLSVLAGFNGLTNLSGVKEVNLSTGCFGSEGPAIEHLALVREALGQLHCTGQIGMLTSVLRTDAGFDRIKAKVGNFHMIMTTECFERRAEILKDSKASLTPEMMPGILASAKRAGLDTSFTYIVGLDRLDIMDEHVGQMAPHLTRFPNFQVYQPHDPIMELYTATGADQIEYYLTARKKLERIFKDAGLRPEGYSNYRPFWYFEFADESLITEEDRTIRLDDGHVPGHKKSMLPITPEDLRDR